METPGSLIAPSGERLWLAADSRVGKLAGDLVRVASAYASSTHAVIKWEDGFWGITDFSKNGTYIDGRRIRKEERQPLRAGHRLAFGNSEETWLLEGADAPTSFARSDRGIWAAADEGALVLPPDEGKAEVLIYQEFGGNWIVERGEEVTTLDPRLISHLIRTSEDSWAFYPRLAPGRTIPWGHPRSLLTATLHVRPSPNNGDITYLWVEFPDGETEKICFAWCNLVGFLARAWCEDANTPEFDRGFAWNEVIYEETLIPILNQANSITLARKWFRAQGVVDGDQIVVARPRQRRIGIHKIVFHDS